MSFKRVRFLSATRQALRTKKGGIETSSRPRVVTYEKQKGGEMASKDRIKELSRQKTRGDIGFLEEAELEEALSRKKGRLKVLKRKQNSAPIDISKTANALNYITYANSFDRKAFVHFENTASSAKRHNLREYETIEQEPDYFMPTEYRKENEFWQLRDEKGEIITPKALFNAELAKYGKGGRGKGKRPKFENSDKEALIVLNESHTLDDLLKVKDELEKFLNITCYSIAIHRDEGHFRKDGTPCINYHAHLNFITIKDKRQNFRLTYTKHKFGAVQSMVAKLLKMQRGDANSHRPNLKPKEYRAFINAEQDKKEIQKAIKRANKKSNKKAVQTATAELKAQLNALKTPKFSRKLAYQHLKFKVYPSLEKKFDELGINREQNIRKHLFALIANFAKNFDTGKIDFENFCKQIQLYETAILTPLENQRQERNTYIDELERNLKNEKAKNSTLTAEKENLQAQLDTANAEIKALKENSKKAAEAQQEKAAEPKQQAADKIPPQNDKNGSNFVENEKKVEIPAEIKKDDLQAKFEKDYNSLINKHNDYEKKKKAGILFPQAKERIRNELIAKAKEFCDKCPNTPQNAEKIKQIRDIYMTHTGFIVKSKGR